MGRLILMVGLAVMLNACSIFFHQPVWIESMPDQQEFVDVYVNDQENQELQDQQEYLAWVSAFYLGNELSSGWIEMTESVLERTPESESQHIIQSKLEELGKSISAEWAKDNSVRLLSTRSVGVWGDALLAALEQDDLVNYIEILENDVNELLQGRLSNEDIYFGRYYEDEW